MKKLILIAALGLALTGCATRPATGLAACRIAAALPLSAGKDAYQDPERAITLWTRCADQGPQTDLMKSLALRMRSHAHKQLEQYDAAIADVEQAQRLSPPKTAWDFINIASLYRDSGQPGKALETLRKMQADRIGMTGRGTPEGMPIYYHLGWTLNDLKQWPEAVETLTEGLTYQPGYAWAYMQRALAYDAMGNRERAQKDLNRGRELLGENRKPGDREQQIESLRKPPYKDLLSRYSYDAEAFAGK